jgi:hypothetical protein
MTTDTDTESVSTITVHAVRLPDALWDALGRAAALEGARVGVRVTRADLIRQGAAQRVREADEASRADQETES